VILRGKCTSRNLEVREEQAAIYRVCLQLALSIADSVLDSVTPNMVGVAWFSRVSVPFLL